jgi:hypothetical protein
MQHESGKTSVLEDKKLLQTFLTEQAFRSDFGLCPLYFKV